MPRETTDLTVEGVNYKITQVGARTGDTILFRFGQAIALGFSSGLSVAGLLRSIQHLSIEDFRWVREEMVKTTKVGIVDKLGGGTERFVPLGEVYDDHFAGKYGAAMTWLKGAVEANFGGFFGDLQGVVDTAKASLSTPPKEAAGSFGG